MRRTRETKRQADAPTALPRLAEGLRAALEEVERSTRTARRSPSPVRNARADRAVSAEPDGPGGHGSRRLPDPAAAGPESSTEDAPAAGMSEPARPAVASSVEHVSGAEVARRLGVSRERVRQWAVNPRYGFPQSTGRSGPAKLWRWTEVERWAVARGRRTEAPAPDR